MRKGWTVSQDCIFVDDGISGAEFVKRPGFLRVMNALKPKPVFDVLIMSEESRLGREQIETAYALKQITDAGVRIFFYLEDRERTLDNAMDKVMLSLTNFAAEMERGRAKQRTYDALLRKAKSGHVTGGRVYGYDNREVSTYDGRRLHVVRVVNDNQAAVVRRVFEMYASKMGLTRIAKALNAENIPPPRSNAGWAPSAIREMLYRPLYRGEIVWNELQKYERGGTKHRRRRAPNEWIKIQAPELQIVSDDLSKRVESRLAEVQHFFIRSGGEGMRGKLLGRPSMRDIDSPYLLSGFARCFHCGGPIEASGRDNGKPRRTYGCAYHRKRGKSICKNNFRIDQDVLDKVLLQSISDILDYKIMEAAVETALAKLRSGEQDLLDRRTAIERELSLVESYEKNLVDAIARGENMDPLLAKLRIEEKRKKELIEELDRLTRPTEISEINKARIKRELRSRISDAKSLLGRQRTQARQILRKLLEGPIICEAFVENDKRGYKLTGKGSYLRLLPGTVDSPCVVSPTGFPKGEKKDFCFSLEVLLLPLNDGSSSTVMYPMGFQSRRRRVGVWTRRPTRPHSARKTDGNDV